MCHFQTKPAEPLGALTHLLFFCHIHTPGASQCLPECQREGPGEEQSSLLPTEPHWMRSVDDETPLQALTPEVWGLCVITVQARYPEEDGRMAFRTLW